MAYDQLKLKNQICHRLYLASNGITRIYRPFLKRLGITYPQYVVMMALWEVDRITMSELASTTQIDKGFLASLVERLVSDGILKVQIDEHDRRKKIIALSAKGLKMQESAKEIPFKILQFFDVNPENETEGQALIKLLDKINLKLTTLSSDD